MSGARLAPHIPARSPGIAERLSRLIAVTGLAGLVILAVASVIDIIGRELFAAPIDGFSDVADMLVVFAAAACFPVSLAERHHVAVRFVGQLHWRLREALELFGHALLLVVFALIVWQLTVYTADVFRRGQTTWLMHIPVWPLWMLTTSLLAACIPVQAIVVWEQVRRVLSAVPVPSLHAEQSVEVGDPAGDVDGAH